MKNKMKTICLLAVLALSCVACDHKPSTPSNAAMRDMERDSMATSSGREASNSDRALQQRIQRFLMEDEVLSPQGKVIRVTVVDGVATLRGPVSQEREKQEIERKIRNIEGVKTVDNQLTTSRNNF